ncbi:MAG: molybdopterin-containing oxidoreductase family protein [Myxococcota bacterium]
MGYTRREFIKISAAGAGAAALGSGLTTRWWGLDAPAHADPGTEGDRVVPTFCELCFWKCGVLAHVRDGKVTKLEGNPHHPLSNGRLCPRGAGGTGLLYDPDRLRTPLIRAKERGQDVFKEASWDSALNLVAENMQKVKDRHGPEALALFSHGFGGSWFKRLVKAYGTPNIGAPSYAQCRGPREAAFTLTYGAGLGSPEPVDMRNSRCITLFGSHLGENMHNTQVQDFAEAMGRGAELVVVDPRFSTAAGKARYWLPIKPGTDLALMLAWMHVILKEKRYDADYVARYTVGLEKLEEEVADKTPEWAYPLTGIRPDLIRETARFISSFRPASLIHPGRHTTWTGDDTQRLRGTAILTALLGAWGRRGGYITHHKMKVPGFPGPAYPEHPPLADQPKKGGYPMAHESLASGLRAASFPGTAAYDIKAWLVYGTNLIQSLPDARETIEAIQNLDFIATVDVLPAEIAGWSDVVLPEATYLERDDDIYSSNFREPFIAVRQKAVEPMYDSKPGWWIAKELGQRLGLEEYFDFADAAEFVKKRAELGGYDYRELSSKGAIRGKLKPTCEEEGMAIPIFTESGKIELASSILGKLGFDEVPKYYPPEEPPPGMFRLLTGRAPQHTFGRTTNNRLLASVYRENSVWLNRDAAKSLPGFGTKPLRDGEKVVLVNQDDVRSTPVRVNLTERIRGDAVYLVHGWGHTARGLKYAFGRGASDSELTTRYKNDPIMGGTGTNVNFVRFERPEDAA